MMKKANADDLVKKLKAAGCINYEDEGFRAILFMDKRYILDPQTKK